MATFSPILPTSSTRSSSSSRRRVNVGRDRLLAAAVEARGAANRDVLADLADQLDALVLELLSGLGPVPVHGLEHLLGEGEELVVLGHRLRLAADGNERSAVFVHA